MSVEKEKSKKVEKVQAKEPVSKQYHPPQAGEGEENPVGGAYDRRVKLAGTDLNSGQKED